MNGFYRPERSNPMPPCPRMRPEQRNLMPRNESKTIECDATRPCRQMLPKYPNCRRCPVGECIPKRRIRCRPCLPDAPALLHVPVLRDATALPDADAMPNACALADALALPDAVALPAQRKQAKISANATGRRHNKTIKTRRQDKTSANATGRSRK